MPVFNNLKGVAAPLDIQNVDTDMIIPKEYLKTIRRTGLGFAAFAELRYHNPVEVAAAGTPVVTPRWNPSWESGGQYGDWVPPDAPRCPP